CSFAGNFAPWLGAAVIAKRATTLNMYSCTIVSSLSYGGSAIEVQNGSSMHIENCIFYYNANYKGQVLDSQYYSDSSSTVSMVSCHVQGTGAADPEFLINPASGNGTWGDGDDNYGDLHLQVTSPCINAGYGSGSTVYDRDGDSRFANGALDIGSDECNFDLATVNSNERVTLNPVGAGTKALHEETYITLDNTAGGDNSTVEAIQIGENIHPDQSAYRVVGSTLIVETSLADGDYEMTLVVPFTYDDLGGLAWNSIVLSYFDVGSSSWVSAGAGTLWVEQVTMPTMEELRLRPLGDYGVYWDSSDLKGFAWANVDHTTDFAPLAYNRPGDFDGSGQININDLILLMENWQLSQSDEQWQDRYDISEPADGIIDLRDFAIMASHWLE
ncbi:MAG: hypothetical protein JXM68_05605, partial [Sedimentisphaerales bacterium]|nr:hypothetical protein [Sedimentisphaerales bacterium]